MIVFVREVVYIPWVGLLPGRNMNGLGWKRVPGVGFYTQFSCPVDTLWTLYSIYQDSMH